MTTQQDTAATSSLAPVARSSGVSVVGAAVAALAGFAVTAIITNALPVAQAGLVFASTSLLLVAVGVVQLGGEVGVVKSLPALWATGRSAHAGVVVGAALATALVASGVVSTLGWVFASDVAGLVAPDADPGALAQQVRVLALALPFAAAASILLAATRGLRTMRPTVVVDSLGRSCLQLVLVGGTALLGLGAVAAVVAWALPYATSAAVAGLWFVVLLRRRGRPPADVAPGEGSPRSSLADYWRFTAPRALATMSQVVLKRADIVLVAALRSPAEAALYAAASRFVVVGQLGVQALQQALSPHLSALFATGTPVAAAQAYRAATAWSMLLAWPLYLAAASLAPELLQVFGSEYTDVAPVVVLLCLTMLFATGCGAVDAVLLMSGHSRLSLANNVVALVLNLVLNLLLVPSLGALGAGIAWSAAIVLRNVLPLAQVWRLYGISPLGRPTVSVALVSVLGVGFLPLVVRLAGGSGWFVLASVVVGVGAFAWAVHALRGPLELSAFRGLLKRRARVAPRS